MPQEIPGIQNRELYEYSQILIAAVKKMLHLKGGLVLSAEPDITEEKIVEFGRRMRVDGLSKFSEKTVFSNIVFYLSKTEMDNKQAIGSLVFYIPISYIAKLLWIFDYPRIDEDDETAVLDGCGTIANLLSGWFVKGLCGFGYIHLEMSHFESFINTAVNGVEFSSDQKVKHRIDFCIKGQKKLVAELTMGYIPRY